MKICDSVTTSAVRGRRPYFLDDLIEEQILYFTLIWDLLCYWLYELECAFQHLYVPHTVWTSKTTTEKRKDLRQILKEPKLKHKNDPVIGRETDSTQCETFGS